MLDQVQLEFAMWKILSAHLYPNGFLAMLNNEFSKDFEKH